MVGALLLTMKIVARCAINMPAICHSSFKFSQKSDDAPTLSIRSVMGLKKTRAFLIERAPQRSPTKQPVTLRYSPEVIAYFKSTG